MYINAVAAMCYTEILFLSSSMSCSILYTLVTRLLLTCLITLYMHVACEELKVKHTHFLCTRIKYFLFYSQSLNNKQGEMYNQSLNYTARGNV